MKAIVRAATITAIALGFGFAYAWIEDVSEYDLSEKASPPAATSLYIKTLNISGFWEVTLSPNSYLIGKYPAQLSNIETREIIFKENFTDNMSTKMTYTHNPSGSYCALRFDVVNGIPKISPSDYSHGIACGEFRADLGAYIVGS